MTDNWIAIEDELPENDKSVLVLVRGKVEPSQYRADGHNFWFAIGYLESDGYYRTIEEIYFESPTHWQPLPQPPESEEL